MATPIDECHARCDAAIQVLYHARAEYDLAQLRSDLWDAEHYVACAFADLHHAFQQNPAGIPQPPCPRP